MTDRSVIDRLGEALWRQHLLMVYYDDDADLNWRDRLWGDVDPETRDSWRWKAVQLETTLPLVGLAFGVSHD